MRAAIALALTLLTSFSVMAACDQPAFVFAFDAIERPGAGDVTLSPTGARTAVLDGITSGKAQVMLDRLPDRVYEDSATMREIVVTKWDCADDLLAHWQGVGRGVTAPASEPDRFFVVSHYGPAPTQNEGTGTKPDLIPERCNAPILLLGVNTITDPAQYEIYRKALSGSRLTFRHGFRRIFTGAPAKVLAGTWPENTTMTLSEWPCIEAFEKFHYSDAYQKEILPLRKNAARYRLAAFLPHPNP